jgi:predicted RND superfamily exporter protein
VLQDAWRQSAAQPAAISQDKVKRFAWAYRRASNAMTVTSFTTFMAFAAAAATPVPAISAFGIFASFVVLFDFALVITWFAAALMAHEAYFNTPRASCGRNQPLSNYCCGICPAPCCKHKQHEQTPSADLKVDSNDAEIDVEALGSAERWFFNNASKFADHKIKILGSFAVLVLIMSAYAGAKLKPAHQLDPFFPDDHPVTRLMDISENGFLKTSTDRKFAVMITWGLNPSAPVDRTGTQDLDEKDLGM